MARAMAFGFGDMDLTKLPREVLEMIMKNALASFWQTSNEMRGVALEMMIRQKREYPRFNRKLELAAAHELGRLSTEDWLLRCLFSMRDEVDYTKPDRPLTEADAATGVLRARMQQEAIKWYHLAKFRFHGLVAIANGRSSTIGNTLNEHAKILLTMFVDHLGERCPDCEEIDASEVRKVADGAVLSPVHDVKKALRIEAESSAAHGPNTTKHGPVYLWDTRTVTTMDSAFARLGASRVIDTRLWDTSGVSSMSSLMSQSSCTVRGMELWNVSKVEKMDSMFEYATAFNVDIGGWDTRVVDNMKSMFKDAAEFNRDIGHWNTRAVRNMELMFCNATSFNGNIGRWNTQKVQNMSFMFSHASKFNRDISKWDLRRCTSVKMMFYGSGTEGRHKPLVGLTVRSRDQGRSNIKKACEFFSGRPRAHGEALCELDVVHVPTDQDVTTLTLNTAILRSLREEAGEGGSAPGEAERRGSSEERAGGVVLRTIAASLNHHNNAMSPELYLYRKGEIKQVPLRDAATAGTTDKRGGLCVLQ